MRVTIEVNGESADHEVEPRLLLVQYLREVRGLTGTHVGCDTSSCGACTVLLDGESVKSCTVLAAQADGRSVLTVEGVAGDGEFSPVQEGFRQCHGLQCGFCTPGMIMAATGILLDNPSPSRRRDPPRARGQPVPLHRLPHDRRVGAVGRGQRRRRQCGRGGSGSTGMIPAAFDYVRAGSAEEAVALLTEHGDEAKLLAGGHSLLPLMKLRLATPGGARRRRPRRRPVLRPRRR